MTDTTGGRQASRDPFGVGGGAGGWERPRSAWRAPVLLGLLSALAVFLILTLAGSWIRGREVARLPNVPPPQRPPAVDVWVGEPAPGVKVVLSAVFNEPEPDRGHDELLNHRLSLPDGRGLAYYQLVVFNTSEAPVTLRLKDGAISITPKGGDPLPMRSLAALAGKGTSPAVGVVLSALGATTEVMEVPPGRKATHLVAFDRRVPLGEAVSVAREDGTAFHPRRISRQRWFDLLEAPTVDELKDL